MRQIEKGKAFYCNPGKPFIMPLPIRDGASIRSSDTQSKSPQMIKQCLCGYLGVMTSWYFCNSSCLWSPLIQ